MLFSRAWPSIRSSLLTILVAISVAACGGGGGGGDATASQPASPSTDNPVTPSQDEPSSDDPLEPFALSVSANAPQVTWTDANAVQYRILVWEENSEPQEYFTSGLELTINQLEPDQYVIAEAYDEFGNSIFSNSNL